MKVFLVGGFLGSGKTTAIHQATLSLEQAGKKIGIVTNDQGDQLVDTQFIRAQHMAVREVTQGCFCCNFHQLTQSIEALQQMRQTDFIFAESVGSCTDLVATVLKPLLAYDKAEDAVLSVFADVQLLCSYLLKSGDILNGNSNYIYEKQLEEADVIVVSKIDTLNEKLLKEAKKLIEGEFGLKDILYQNSLNPVDIQRWIIYLKNFPARKSRQSLQINYDDYAAGEAEMAWFDGEFEIATRGSEAGEIGYQIMNGFYNKIRERKYVIGHLKFLMSSMEDQAKVSFTAIQLDGFQMPGFKKTNKITLLINARVKTGYETLDELVDHAIRAVVLTTECTIQEHSRRAFQPGYPKPTCRI